MEKHITGLAILLTVVALVLGGCIGYLALPEKVVTNTIHDAPEVTSVEYNDTAIRLDIAAIQATLDEDDTFKASCKALATSEWSNRDYKDLFNAMDDLGLSIIDKEDISNVIVKDDDVSGIDVDEGNCDVSQKLKVYFEDADGDSKKAYITVDTEVVDNDVEDQVFHVVAS